MPVPVAILELASMRWKRSKILPSSDSGIPMPVSLTLRTASARVDRSVTVISPLMQYLNELPIRLKQICE